MSQEKLQKRSSANDLTESRSKASRKGVPMTNDLSDLTSIHRDSFNWCLREGLQLVARKCRPAWFQLGGPDCRVKIGFDSLELHAPRIIGLYSQHDSKLYPSQCRRAGLTYSGTLQARLVFTVNEGAPQYLERQIGQLPIMVRSAACNLYALNEADLVRRGEEPSEMGGYFIVNGNERIIRMLVMPRRNYPLVCSRGGFKTRGRGFTEHSCILRSVALDETSSANILHWRLNGGPVLTFSVRKRAYFVPIALLLRALSDRTDLEIYEAVVRGAEDSLSLRTITHVLLAELSRNPQFVCRAGVLRYLGDLFREVLLLPSWVDEEEVGRHLLRHFVAIHLEENDEAKFQLLCFMIRKLHAYVTHECCEETNDNIMFQEALLPGHLYVQVLKDKLELWLMALQRQVERRLALDIKLSEASAAKRMSMITTETLIASSVPLQNEITAAMRMFIATGNLVTSSGLGLMQTNGLVIPADNVNALRFAAHFRSIHRGAFFTEMRSSSVRRLVPEAWGFICPVHTPDGAPCGLLNHITTHCRATVAPCLRAERRAALIGMLVAYGLEPVTTRNSLGVETPSIEEEEEAAAAAAAENEVKQTVIFPVLLDGQFLGWIRGVAKATTLANLLRNAKVTGSPLEGADIPSQMEIGWVPPAPGKAPGQYPGLYLHCGSARLLRPVRHLSSSLTEWIGTFEQPYLEIACLTSDLQPRSSHQELDPNTMFSFMSSLTPYPDHNQGPRNIYQCQMGKQTMGHSYYALKHRADNKLYRLITPQAPLVRTAAYNARKMDHTPMGFNAVVAVISYTGYDMEDAMVINKASYDRGISVACIYKSIRIDLTSKEKMSVRRNVTTLTFNSRFCFGCGEKGVDGLEADGFPAVGTRLELGSPEYAYVDNETLDVHVERYRGDMIAYVESVSTGGAPHRATLTLRVLRKPDIGDKYSSRHGQKGVCSLLLPTEDFPWTADGVVPDIIFNPHGFPSRMTVGMMLEFLAGKSSSLTGSYHGVTASPYGSSEREPPHAFWGDVLESQGYERLGTERMYCGTSGRLIEAEIFCGVVYYQRLRHMVGDKWQVRATGRVDQVCRQPIKGRAVGGGVRLGEMERDCLLAHGAVACLRDRLMECSDATVTFVCGNCGVLGHTDFRRWSGSKDAQMQLSQFVGATQRWRRRWFCVSCGRERDNMRVVALPHVLRVLSMELAVMNIRLRLDVCNLFDGTSLKKSTPEQLESTQYEVAALPDNGLPFIKSEAAHFGEE